MLAQAHHPQTPGSTCTCTKGMGAKYTAPDEVWLGKIYNELFVVQICILIIWVPIAL